jgi:hypothetical protein
VDFGLKGLAMMKWVFMLALALVPAVAQGQVSGVLSGPDPAQMESAPDLGYKAVPTNLTMPADVKIGASSSVAVLANGNILVFNRGEQPLMEFDQKGTFVRAFGKGMYNRPHGMRVDSEGNIWTTDVRDHTVIKLSPKGDVLMTLGTRG